MMIATRKVYETEFRADHCAHFIYVIHSFQDLDDDEEFLTVTPGFYMVSKVPRSLQYRCESILSYYKGWKIHKSRHLAEEDLMIRLEQSALVQLLDPDPMIRYIGKLRHEGKIDVEQSPS